MSKQKNQPVEKSVEKYDSVLGLFARFFWMLGGNAVLVVSILLILQHKGKTFHTADIVFWIAAATLIIARYLDIKFCNGLTASGKPASMKHWRKYSIGLTICAAILWAACHLINYLTIR